MSSPSKPREVQISASSLAELANVIWDAAEVFSGVGAELPVVSITNGMGSYTVFIWEHT